MMQSIRSGVARSCASRTGACARGSCANWRRVADRDAPVALAASRRKPLPPRSLRSLGTSRRFAGEDRFASRARRIRDFAAARESFYSRGMKKRVKFKDKKRTASSRAWLTRQLNDPYVKAAKEAGYRSRAAFKLIELDQKFHFLKRGARVLDLWAAPGGWSQVSAARVGATGAVVAADVLAMDPIAGVTFLEADLLAPETLAQLRAALGGKAQVVLSDMAAPTTGHRATDHLRTTALMEAALDVAEEMLAPGGVFVGKVFQGGAAGAMLARLKRSFASVKHMKPPASRAKSVELYLVATGFRGRG